MIRHRLIKWLAFGDMIILNAEFNEPKTLSPDALILRPREASSTTLIENILWVSNNGQVQLETTKTIKTLVKDCIARNINRVGFT